MHADVSNWYSTCRHRGAARQRGFTLVEMLVVISIIVTLAALLLPAVLKARESARSATCMSNLHQISISAKREFTMTRIKAYLPYRWEDPNHVNRWGVNRPRWQWIEMADYVGRPAQNPDTLRAYDALLSHCSREWARSLAIHSERRSSLAIQVGARRLGRVTGGDATYTLVPLGQ